MKKRYFCISTILCMVVLCSCMVEMNLPETEIIHDNTITSTEEIVYIQGSYFYPPFEYFLETWGDSVIIGTVQSAQEQYVRDDNFDESEMIRFSRIYVEEVIYGDLQEGDIITVFERGNGINYIYTTLINTGGYLKEGDRIMFILEHIRSNGNFVELNNIEHLLPIYGFSSHQGRIWLDENGEIDLERNAYPYSPVIQRDEEITPAIAISDERIFVIDSYIDSDGVSRAKRGETLQEFIGRIEAVLADNERAVVNPAGE